ncbi:uncharacterized protein B0H64DRAFT_447737 [Chaetomium fimeti]|uniref:Uncharacterized protein n=1 Tax=Chaetomium fimeti TaxID=1854472 RepID=A0AAE0HNQ1_9PEZI|nr:hypothetical protein B0H64DRAFT_447737 [Chaetomium fimeti]
MADSPTPDPGLDCNIKVYKILANGSMQAVDKAVSLLEGLENDGKPGVGLLCLVEGLSESTITELRKLLPSLPDAFISAHLCDNLAQIDSALDDDHLFLAKWSRAAAQPKEAWLHEKKLRTSNSPFNVDDANPAASRLDHKRYDHITEPFRSYNPIREFDIGVPYQPNIEGGHSRTTTSVLDESCREKDIEGQHNASQVDERSTVAEPALKTKICVQDMFTHAAQECISFYHESLGDMLIGILIFDQPRQYRITEVHYNLMTGGEVESKPGSPEHAFQDDSSYPDRFISNSRLANMAPPVDKIVEAVIDTIVAIVLEDQRKLLASISKALDEIELSMGKDVNSPKNWRDFPPGWRNHLFHQSETIGYFLSRSPESNTASPPTSHTPRRDRALKQAEKQLEATMARLEGTYQVLMSSMSILESEKAIEQAEVVTRLTNLAFFFIPLTFVSGLFGMNLNEFDKQLTVAMWVGISLGVTAAAYFIRFRRPLAIAAYQTPQTIRSMRWDMLVARMRRWTQVIRSLSRDLASVVFFAVVGVAVWLAATLPATDEAKIGITASLQLLTQLLWTKGLTFENFRLQRLQRVVKAALFAGIGVAIWAISTSALPVDARIGLALVVVRLRVLGTSTWFNSIQSSQNDSSTWIDFHDNCRIRLPVHPLWFDAARAILCSALGVALWKLFTSPLSDAAKVGVAVGVMPVPIAVLGLPFVVSESVRRSDWRNLLMAMAVITIRGVVAYLPIQAVVIWKISTATTLSVSTKLGVGVTFNFGFYVLIFLLGAAGRESESAS